jgi:hypothetical protein
VTRTTVPIYFVVRYSQQRSGSSLMRSHDLIRSIAPFLPARLVPSILKIPGPRFPRLQRIWARTRPAGGLYFLTKSALSLDLEAADILRRRSHGLAVDYVDADLTPALSRLADVHICSSHAQETRIAELQSQRAFALGPTKVILHNASQALYGLPQAQQNRFATVYFGTPALTRIPETLADRVDVLDARNHANFLAALDQVPRYPLHYCIRSDKETSALKVKPFTKGITAAVCGANVIVSRDVPDATRLLGDDYPFLAENNSDAEILAVHNRAERQFNGPDWFFGLERLAAVKQEVSGQSLAKRFEELAAMMGVD